MVFSFLAISNGLPGETNKSRWGLTINESEENQSNEQKKQKVRKESLGRDDASKGKSDQPIQQEEKKSTKNTNSQKRATKGDNQAAGEKLETEKSIVKPHAASGQSEKSDIQKTPDLKTDLQNQIRWENKKQKDHCEKYLAQLKERFLQARYYSIQGEPCGTAENAQAFMELAEKCNQDCPQGYLRQRGYTTRIIRNLSWLSKLGSERCSGNSSN